MSGAPLAAGALKARAAAATARARTTGRGRAARAARRRWSPRRLAGPGQGGARRVRAGSGPLPGTLFPRGAPVFVPYRFKLALPAAPPLIPRVNQKRSRAIFREESSPARQRPPTRAPRTSQKRPAIARAPAAAGRPEPCATAPRRRRRTPRRRRRTPRRPPRRRRPRCWSSTTSASTAPCWPRRRAGRRGAGRGGRGGARPRAASPRAGIARGDFVVPCARAARAGPTPPAPHAPTP
jgi:hypothetical protein